MVFLLSLSFCLSLLFLQGSLLYSSLLYSIRIPSLNVLKQMQLACTKYPAARASQELRRSFIVPGDGVSMFPFACAYCTFSPRLKKLSESYQHVSTKSRVLYKMVKMVPGCAKGQKKFIPSRSGKLCRLLQLLSLASQHPKQLMKPKSKPQWHATCLKRSQNNTKCYRHARPLQRAMHQHAAWNPGCRGACTWWTATSKGSNVAGTRRIAQAMSLHEFTPMTSLRSTMETCPQPRCKSIGKYMTWNIPLDSRFFYT